LKATLEVHYSPLFITSFVLHICAKWPGLHPGLKWAGTALGVITGSLYSGWLPGAGALLIW
jgi:hypothetical protein